MEPLPSDVARLVLGYLLDSCPAVADQFLAASPDLAEVRRLRPRALRPFGLSLVELLTEHATAFSLVDDLYAAIERPGTRTCGGDFLSKLRRLLSLIAETKGVSVSSLAADHSPGVSSGGPRHGPEADTAGRWSVGDHITDSDEPPAIGADWADTPTREAAAPTEDDSRTSWDATYGSADHQSSPCGSPGGSPGSPGEAGEADDCKPQEDISMDSKPAGETVTQTALTDEPVVKSERDRPESETTDCSVPRRTTGGGGSGSPPDDGDGTSSAAPEGAGMKSRRKIRPPRRACPERLTALVGNRPISQPVGWIYGQVRHLLPAGRSQVARTADTPSDGQSSHRSLQTSEFVNPEPAAAANKRGTHPPESYTPSPPPLPQSDETNPPDSPVSGRTGLATVCAATAASSSTAAPASTESSCTTAVRSRTKRTGSPPRRRRAGQCGMTAGELSRHERSRPPHVLVERAGRVALADGAVESAAEADTVLEPMDDASGAAGDVDSEADTVVEPMDDASNMTESSDEDGAESLVVDDDPPQSPVATSKPTAAPLAVPGPAGALPNSPPESDSTSRLQSVARAGGVPCTTDALRVSPPPPASSARCGSPPPPGSEHVPSPPPSSVTARVPSPSPGQLSGRSSLPSGGRSTPASQRSLRICLSPVSWGTPSANGSFREGETPTSARQTSARPDRSGGSSSRRRAVAPRRRLLNDLRRGIQPCGEMPPPEGLSRPAAQSTPSVSGRVPDVAAGAGVSDDSPVAGGPRRTPSHTHGPAAKRPPPTGDGSPSSPPVKVPSRNTRDLLKSVDIMSFLSRIHSSGSK